MDNRVYGSDSWKDGVLSPLAQALITGVLTGCSVGAVLWLLSVESAWRWSVAAIPLTWLLMWLLSLSHWRRSLERLLWRDLDNDGYIGEPEEQPAQRLEPVRVVLEKESGSSGEFIDLPAKPEQLKRLADGLLSERGRSLSLSAWTGAGAPFSRSEFERLRDELVRRGLACWRNPSAPAQGAELSSAGRAVLRHFASETHSPTLKR